MCCVEDLTTAMMVMAMQPATGSTMIIFNIHNARKKKMRKWSIAAMKTQCKMRLQVKTHQWSPDGERKEFGPALPQIYSVSSKSSITNSGVGGLGGSRKNHRATATMQNKRLVIIHANPIQNPPMWRPS